MLLDFIVELLFIFPVDGGAPSNEEVVTALTNKIPKDTARANPNALDVIFAIDHVLYTFAFNTFSFEL